MVHFLLESARFCLRFNGPSCSTPRWLDFLVVVQLLPCYLVEVVSDRSLGVLLLHMDIEWALHPLTAPKTTPHPFGTTPPTSTLSTDACSRSVCRTEEGTGAGLEGTDAAGTLTVT